MKKVGRCSDFTSLRNDELMRSFRRVLAEKDFFDISSDFALVVAAPCSRFWVSEERATNVISAMLRGLPVLDSMRPAKRAMFTEIYHRVLADRQQHPTDPLCDAVFRAVNSPAPCFYMEPLYARNVIYLIKQGHYSHHD